MIHAIAVYLAMGGYARFVWPAYGVAIGVLGGLAVLSWRRYRASRRALEAALSAPKPGAPKPRPPAIGMSGPDGVPGR